MNDKNVAVWRMNWLPSSETFIANQISNLARWSARPCCLERVEGNNGMQPFSSVSPGSFVHTRRIAIEGIRRSSRLTNFLQQCQLVHAHFGPDATVLAPIAARARVPVLATFHGFDVTELSTLNSRSARRYRRRLPGLFSQAAGLIAVSGFIADQLKALGAPAEKVIVHHIGVVVPDEAAPIRCEGPVLFVGRLVEKKGVSDLLSAMAALPPERRRLIEIVGDGPLRPQLEDQARQSGLEVKFFGSVSPDGVAARMSKACMLAAPSKRSASGDCEGLPTTVQEAGARGLPVLSTRHAGIPEVIVDGETGVLADEGDVAGLASGMFRLLDSPDWAASLAHAGRAKVSSHFNIVQQTAQLELLYDQLARS